MKASMAASASWKWWFFAQVVITVFCCQIRFTLCEDTMLESVDGDMFDGLTTEWLQDPGAMSAEPGAAQAHQAAPTTTAEHENHQPAHVETCWASGGDAKMGIGCVHKRPLLFEDESRSYPLSGDMLARSIAYAGDTLRRDGMWKRAHDKKSLNVVVLGASVARGHLCFPPSDGSEACQWPQLFQQWLEQRMSGTGVSVSVKNRARVACASPCQVLTLPNDLPMDEEVDLVVVDLSTNDGHLPEALHIARTAHLREGELVFDASDVGVHSVQYAQEALVRHALAVSSSPAVVFLEAFRDHHFTPEGREHWGAQEVLQPVAEAYGVPIVSYRDAVWPVFKERPHHLDQIFWETGGDGAHPGWRSHQLYADTLAYFFDLDYVRWSSGAKTTPLAGLRQPNGPPLFGGTAVLEQRLRSEAQLVANMRAAEAELSQRSREEHFTPPAEDAISNFAQNEPIQEAQQLQEEQGGAELEASPAASLDELESASEDF